MDYITFRSHLAPHTVFSLATIKLYAPECTSVQLGRWVDKGYLIRLIKGYYMFSDMELRDPDLFLIGNIIYAPSYISAETALSYYGLIPEAVYQTTSMTTRHTYKFDTPVGEFAYSTVKSELFFGYTLLPYKNHNICIASPEKALLDFLYKYPHIQTSEDIEELRLNTDELEKVNPQRYIQYMQPYSSSFKKRASNLLDYLHAYIS